jgi:hypothetical protein
MNPFAAAGHETIKSLPPVQYSNDSSNTGVTLNWLTIRFGS